ncbi:ZNF428 isoform 2, partial [Pongo abelii]
MTETREPAETGGYASLEEDDEDLSPGWKGVAQSWLKCSLEILGSSDPPASASREAGTTGPEHSSDSEYTLSEPDSEEEEDEEEEEEETTDDPEYDPGYKVKQRLGGGRGGPSRRAPRAAQPPGPLAQPCQLCGRSPLGEAPPGTPPCRLCCPATAPQEAPAPEGRALGEEEEEPPRAGEGRPVGREEEEEDEEEGTYHCTECEDSFDNLGELHGHFMLHAR